MRTHILPPQQWHVFRRTCPTENHAMKIEQLMTPSPATCGLTENLAQAVERMWDGNCGIIPVVDDAGHVIAIVTDRDISIAAATRGRAPGDIRIDEMERKPVVSCRPEDTVKAALKLMKEHRVRRLPLPPTKASCTASCRSTTSRLPPERRQRERSGGPLDDEGALCTAASGGT
jgi:predicted transcriptional regulator